MTANPSTVSHLGACLDWTLFVGIVGWALSGIQAFRLGMEHFGMRRHTAWLWFGTVAVLLAVVTAMPLMKQTQFHVTPPAMMMIGLVSAGCLVMAMRGFHAGRFVNFLALVAWLFFWAGLWFIQFSFHPAGMAAVQSHQTNTFWIGTGIALCLSLAAVIGSLCIHGRYLASLPIFSRHKATLKRQAGVYGIVILGIVAAGVAVSSWRRDMFVADQGERLVWRVSTAALGLDLDAILRLSGKPADRKMPAFRTLGRQLERLLETNADAENAFVWRVRDGEVVLLAHKGKRSAGDFFSESAPALKSAYLKGQVAPYVLFSAHSLYATANQSITNPTDRQPYAWLAIDFDLASWKHALAEARLQIFAATFLAVLVVTACYGWITNLEIERDFEREKLAMVESERERFARDLHDGLGQTLTGLAYRVRALAGGLQNEQAADARDLAGMLTSAVGEARAIAFAQIPPQLKTGGLKHALAALAENTRKLFGVECLLDVPAVFPAFPEATAHALLQITRESIHNAVRHGRASVITITLQVRGTACHFEVSDNGQGLAENGPVSNGLGMRMINARLREIGGAGEFLPNHPSGVIVRCRFNAAV
jgi:signal transduction histidine kinase